jgi:hypothetical protein
MNLARKVKLRPWHWEMPGCADGPDALAYQHYVKELTYRWAFICQACYAMLDNESGLAEIGDRAFNLAGVSRGDKEAVIDEAKYQAFQRKEAAKMGLDV